MAKARNGEAISSQDKTRSAKNRLQKFISEAVKRRKSLDEWRRGRAVLGYIEGRKVTQLSKELGVTRGSVNRWLQWYEAEGLDGLKSRKPPGATPRLSEEQRAELVEVVERGAIAAGYQSGVWTGPMIADMIEERFGVRYHNHHIPRLLHQLGFSVQRPRKRLARANLEAQANWVNEKFPRIKKKRAPVEGS
jgi:transposase